MATHRDCTWNGPPCQVIAYKVCSAGHDRDAALSCSYCKCLTFPSAGAGSLRGYHQVGLLASRNVGLNGPYLDICRSTTCRPKMDLSTDGEGGKASGLSPKPSSTSVNPCPGSWLPLPASQSCSKLILYQIEACAKPPGTKCDLARAVGEADQCMRACRASLQQTVSGLLHISKMLQLDYMQASAFKGRYFTQTPRSELRSRSTPAGQLCLSFKLVKHQCPRSLHWQVFSTFAALARTMPRTK